MTDGVAPTSPWGVGRVGAGELPHELRRVNWGAAFLAIIWAPVHGLWLWFWGLLAARLAWYVVGYLIDTFASSASPSAAPIRFAVGSLLLAGVDAVFAMRANRLFWEREQARVLRESYSHAPKPGLPTADYAGRQRTWAMVGFALIALSAATLVDDLVSARPAGLSHLASFVGTTLVLSSLYVYDRLRRVQDPPQS